MRRVRQQVPPNQSREPLVAADVTPIAVIQTLIPLGLRAVEERLLAEVDALAGARYARDDGRAGVVRWGAQRGSVFLADQKIPLTVPRVSDLPHGREVPLPTYQALQVPRGNDVGLYRNWVALVIDGKTFGGDQLVLALGVTRTGEKHLLGLVQTATENRTVCAAFLRRLGERGFPLDAALLVVLDGAKGLRAAVRDVLPRAVVQRCQWHKRENVVRYLPRAQHPTWRRKLQAAYAQPTLAQAHAALTRLRRELQLLNASAAASLDEGLDETLTLHRLGVFPQLGTSFKTTNLLESVNARVEARRRRVTRWRTSDQKQRWCAAALLAMESQFRRIKGHHHLPLLERALRTTVPVAFADVA